MLRNLNAASSALLFFLVIAATASPAGEVPFAKLADEFVKARGLPGIELSDAALATVLTKGYVTARLGLFDVWYPADELHEKERIKRFQAVAEALVGLQDTWLEWAADKETLGQAKGESKELRAWIGTWKSLGTIRKKDLEKHGPDLPLLLDTKEAAANALPAYADRVMQTVAPAMSAVDRSGITLILSPTRKDFLGLGSFIGSLNAENKRLLWHDGLALWTSFRRTSIHVLALEHPATYPGQGDITKGLDMNAKEATGMVQHVVQTATEWMIEHCYGESMPPALINGFAMNVVVALYGENNVRSGGGSGGKSTGSYSRFVRGGSSSGGKLPAKSADSHWRKEKGRDLFVKDLRSAQKEGARVMFKRNGAQRDKRAFFSLRSIDGESGYAVEAPFLNGAGHREPVPEEFTDDFLEFHRAYRCAFTHWLIDKARAAKGRTSSQDLMRRLLQELPRRTAGAEDHKPFDDVANDVYGQPLTAEEGGTKSLEWGFLDWLTKRG